MRRMIVPAIALCSILVSAVGWSSPLPQALRRTQVNYASIHDYSVNGALTVESPQAHIKDLGFKLYFKKPNKVKVEAKEGFAFLPKDNTAFGDPALNILSKYTVVSIGRAKLNGALCEVLKAEPKSEAMGVPPMRLWIESRRGLILRTESVIPNGGWSTAEFSYQLVSSKYWMPSRMTAKVISPGSAGPEDKIRRRFPQAPPVNGKMTVVFSDYKINKGIPDSVFSRKAQ